MDKAMFASIDGIETYFEYFANVPWWHFHDVIEYKWFRKYDNEELIDRYYVELVMSDINQEDIVKFIFKDVEMMSDVSMHGYISGLEILNKCKELHRAAYEVLDFEDGAIHMLCSDFSIEVLSVQGIILKKDFEGEDYSGCN